MSMDGTSMGNIYLRRFTPEDWQVYKSIRLEALQMEQPNFGATYSIDFARADAEWINRLTQENYWGFWGLFDGDQCIGLTGIVQQEEDPKGADMIASYIRKAYRGKRLSALYYKARIDWAREKGYKYINVGHRNGNLASKAANQRFGFQYTGTINWLWPDGTYDNRLSYRLEL